MARTDRLEAARRRLETLQRAKSHNTRGLETVAAQIAKHPEIAADRQADSGGRTA